MLVVIVAQLVVHQARQGVLVAGRYAWLATPPHASWGCVTPRSRTAAQLLTVHLGRYYSGSVAHRDSEFVNAGLRDSLQDGQWHAMMMSNKGRQIIEIKNLFTNQCDVNVNPWGNARTCCCNPQGDEIHPNFVMSNL